ncbi:hypothetical protein RI138_08080 [Streptomyces sp. C11-1]|uniref:Uncharacterized protein n=1 Tax=Streptomyces durocortorensis TaxID=2811104 RepID=A0ABY9W6B6_9ACTN|nr:hypothetical protein [Streptomyces durocortorensis]WNF31498.1 hypothetical protein RI138_08080 [Streptomyces durocortorensis]
MADGGRDGPRNAAPRPRRVRHIAFDRPFGIVVLGGADDVPLLTA